MIHYYYHNYCCVLICSGGFMGDGAYHHFMQAAPFPLGDSCRFDDGDGFEHVFVGDGRRADPLETLRQSRYTAPDNTARRAVASTSSCKHVLNKELNHDPDPIS